MTLSFQQVEGKYYETQYSWNGKVEKSKQNERKTAKKIVKKNKAKGLFSRVRSYDIVNGKRYTVNGQPV